MSKAANQSVLQGALLEAYLDEIEAGLEIQEESGVPKEIWQSSLTDMLKQRPYKADTIEIVYRLQYLWRQAGHPLEAIKLIDGDAKEVIAKLPEDDKARAQISSAFWLLDAVKQAGDFARLRQLLLETEQFFCNLPDNQRTTGIWYSLSNYAMDTADYDCARRIQFAIHAILAAEPERKKYRAWDKATMERNIGSIYAKEGIHKQASAHGGLAISTLASASTDQDVDFNDFLNIGKDIIDYAPEYLVDIIDNTYSRIPEDLSIPDKREIEVRLARLKAVALYKQNQLNQALREAKAGRFPVASDNEQDHFTIWVLDRLLEAGQQEEAALLAFESVLNERFSEDHACHIALQKIQNPEERNPYWAITLAFAATRDRLQWICGEEDPEAFTNRHLASAQKLSPFHPAIAVLKALKQVEQKKDYAAALSAFEAAAHIPELACAVTITPLWLCRFLVYGPEKALTMPFVEVPAASWCYHLAVQLEYHIRDELPDNTPWPHDKVADLAALYYERGLQRFEDFFATGQGTFRDGGVHTYSMLCNNLAIYCRNNGDMKRAVDLHHRGINSSPFAEHYYGIMRCYAAMEWDEEFVRAADALWHYASENGYGRHNPAGYMDDVASSLRRLGRDNEIAIWLERLDQWWNSLDQEDKDYWEEHYYLSAVVTILAELSLTQPGDTIMQLEKILPRINAVKVTGITRVAALTFERAGHYQRAIDLYNLSLQEDATNPAIREEQHRITRIAIADCQRHLRAGKPWWRFWS